MIGHVISVIGNSDLTPIKFARFILSKIVVFIYFVGVCGGLIKGTVEQIR